MAGYPVVETLNLNNLRFDNVSQYLTTTTCPANDSKYVFSGDFTIEAWINMTTLPTVGTWKHIINSGTDISFGKSFGFGIGRDLGGQLSLQYWVSTDGINWSGLTSAAGATDYKGTVNGPYLFQAATWYHVAACRTGNTLNLFVNGYLVGQSTTFTYTNFAGPVPVIIGYYLKTTQEYFNGYISNLRVVKGTAVYTAPTPGTTYYANSSVSYTNGNPGYQRSFIPPTVDLTATQSAGGGSTNINAIGGNSTVNTSLLVCQNTSSGSYTSAFVDNSSYAQVINPVGYNPNVNRAIANTTFPYPGYFAMAFSGTAQYQAAPAASAWAFGNGDFTVEAWINPTVLTAGTGIVSSWTGTVAAGTAATSAWVLSMGTGNAANVRFTVSSGTAITGYESTTSGLTAGVWNHVAAVRIANTLNIYTNGVKTYAGAAGAETTNITVATQTCQIAAVGGGTVLNGFISNARVIKANGAYTNTFTPYLYPLGNTLTSNTGLTNYNTIAAAVGNTSGVQLLACRYRSLSPDQSVNGWTLTTTGAPNPTSNVVPHYIPVDNNLLNIVQQPKPNDVGPNFLTVAANTNFSIGTGAFTIEGWFYPTNPTAGHNLITSIPTNTFGVGYWRLALTTGSLLSLTYDGSIAQQVINATSQALTGNTWNHVAVTRTITGANGVITFYVNGTAATNTVVANSVGQFGNSSAALWIGSQEASGPTATFTGLSNNIRVTRGIAVYTGAFTPPASALTTTQSAGTNIAAIGLAANVALLVQANTTTGAITDISPTAAVISVYGNPQSNTYGNNITTSNSIYTSFTNRIRIQQTSKNDMLVKPVKLAHDAATSSAVETIVAKVASSGISARSYKLTHDAATSSAVETMVAKVASIHSNIPIFKRNIPHLLNSSSIPAIQIRLQYTADPNIPVNEYKFTVAANTAGLEFTPRILSVPNFDNPIGTNLYKQPSTSYQFWS